MALGLGNNSANGQINHGDIALMNGAAALTVCCWRLTDLVNSPGDLEKGSTALLWMGNRELHASELPTWDRSTDLYQIPISAWSHHACVFDGSLTAASRIKFFGDGNEQTTTGSTAGTTLLDSTGSAVIIAPSNVSGVWAHLRIWAAALTAAEIQLEMVRYWAVRQTNLLLDAPYDDALNTRDYSPAHANPGTAVGGPPEQQSGPPISYGGKVLVTG